MVSASVARNNGPCNPEKIRPKHIHISAITNLRKQVKNTPESRAPVKSTRRIFRSTQIYDGRRH